MKKRWLACVVCVLCLLGFFSLQLFFQAESKEGTVDLSNESLNQIRLYTPITDLDPSKLIIINDTSPVYAHSFEYEQLLLSFNASNQVVYLNSLHPEVMTSKGITLGDTFEDVVDQYGDEFVIEEGLAKAQQVSYHDEDLQLSFYLTNEIVEQIELKLNQ